jgi:citrate lyase subunit beta/citryl-CoA lyase
MARNLCLFAAASASVAPIDAVYTDFRDLDGLKTEAEAAARDGFTAKAAIHPDQVETINAVFTPSFAACDHARRVVAAFEAAPDSGAVSLDGRMVDRPHLRSAQRILARAAVVYPSS